MPVVTMEDEVAVGARVADLRAAARAEEMVEAMEAVATVAVVAASAEVASTTPNHLKVARAVPRVSRSQCTPL
jgi:hypothetical protein